MKTGLVIQGPVLSPGYGPYEFKEDGSLQRQWIDFNSTNNIIQIASQACEFFDHVVLVTWKNIENEIDLADLMNFGNFSMPLNVIYLHLPRPKLFPPRRIIFGRKLRPKLKMKRKFLRVDLDLFRIFLRV
jgi:hypothetical protein